MFFTDSCKLFCLEKYISSFSSIQNLMLGCFPKTKLTTIFPIVSETNSIKQYLHCFLPVFFKILAKLIFREQQDFRETDVFLDYHEILISEKMKFSIKDFFSKCGQFRTFTEEILTGKLHFLVQWLLKENKVKAWIIINLLACECKYVIFEIRTSSGFRQKQSSGGIL